MSLATVTPLGPLQKHADHATPLVRDAWYVAGLSREFSRALLPRTLLGARVVLYRKQDGSIVALHDRCRHRSFPLSKGKLEGDKVVTMGQFLLQPGTPVAIDATASGS